ncbi:MAG: sigma-70 family RNA polymerase sigma factor [Deltaproteobacteria bacterium]|nr:sigma-70 family RNA polymerase sigma factor [Deltaproteobacteria bacterium]
MDERELTAVYGRVRGTVFRLLGYRDDLEDIVQVAMEAFIKARRTYRGEGSIEGFAGAIAANVARTWLRKQRRGILLRETVAERENWPPIEDGPAEEVERIDKLRRLMEMLDRIKAEYRIACVLYYIENKPVPEIAAMVGASENAVRLRILRGRRALRKHARKDPVLGEWLSSLGGTR